MLGVATNSFLQPLHASPHHDDNMTGQGVRALFEKDLVIDGLGGAVLGVRHQMGRTSDKTSDAFS